MVHYMNFSSFFAGKDYHPLRIPIWSCVRAGRFMEGEVNALCSVSPTREVALEHDSFSGEFWDLDCCMMILSWPGVQNL